MSCGHPRSLLLRLLAHNHVFFTKIPVFSVYWNYEKSMDFQALRWKIAYLCVITSTRRRVKWNRLVNIIDINHKYGVIALLDTQYNLYVSISESGEILVMFSATLFHPCPSKTGEHHTLKTRHRYYFSTYVNKHDNNRILKT